MAIDRRTILGGLAAVPALLSAKVRAFAAEPVSGTSVSIVRNEHLTPRSHPLFGWNTAESSPGGKPTVTIYGTSFLGEGEIGRRFAVQWYKVPVGRHGYTEVEDAEDAILEAILWEHRVSILDASETNGMRIERARVDITRSTLRGPGRVVLMHEADLPLLGVIDGLCWTFHPTMRSYRWTKCAVMSSGLEVWTTRCPSTPLHRGTALVGYRGIGDREAGAHIVDMGDGTYSTLLTGLGPTNHLAEFMSYYRVVELAKPSLAAG